MNTAVALSFPELAKKMQVFLEPRVITTQSSWVWMTGIHDKRK